MKHNWLRGLAREPLLHFLVLGAALFAGDAWLRPVRPASPNAPIVVTQARVLNLAGNFTRTWQRPPTREELAGLIEAHVREEVMVREALALGLDRDDAIIRRRLQQKLEFVSEEAAALAPPTDAQLQAHLAAHPERFRRPARVTFSQIYLDPARRKGALEGDAARLLETLNRAGSAREPPDVGDRLLLLEPRYSDLPQQELESRFGPEFAQALPKLPPGRWAGPVASGYGAHLVRLEALQGGGLATLDEVRPQVLREWANARREALARDFYARLRARHAITVQMPEGAQP